MPIRFYSDVLGKIIEPNYNTSSSMSVEEFEKLLLTKYFGIIYNSDCEEEKENDSNNTIRI